MNLKQVVKELQGRKNMAKMGREIGVTGAYLRALRDGVALNPSWKMMERISKYLEGNK